MTLLIDNSKYLPQIMEFNENKSFYLFMALIRAKDYKDGKEPVLKIKEKQEVLVKTWLVESKESIEHLLPDMLTTVDLFKCRLYMALDRKSFVKSLLSLRDSVDKYLDSYLFNNNTPYSAKAFNKLLTSAASVAESSDRETKRWLFDVDSKADVNILNDLDKVLEDKLLAKLETKNGYHYVTKKDFDAHRLLGYLKYVYTRNNIKFPVELKDNALTLVAIGE